MHDILIAKRRFVNRLIWRFDMTDVDNPRRPRLVAERTCSLSASGRVAVLLAATFPFATPSVALGQDPTGPGTGADDAASRASEVFEAGMTLLSERNWAGALAAFEEAYSLQPDYRALFNIGVCLKNLGRSSEALDAFQRYLSEGGEQVRPEKRTQAEQAIAELQALLSHLRVTADVEGAEIVVNDEVRGTSPMAEPLALDAGHYVVVARASGYRDAREEVDLADGQDRDLALTLEPLGGTGPTPPPETPPPSTSEPWYSDWVGWTISGVGVAAAGVGCYFLWAASDAESNSDTALDLSEAHNLDNDALTDWTVGGVLVGVGGAALITGVVLLAITSDEEAPPADEGSSGVALMPLLGPAGLGLAGTF